MKGKRWFVTVMTVIIFAAMIAGCANTAVNEGKSEEDALVDSENFNTFVIGTTMDIQSISRADYYYNVLSGTLTHMALVRLDENGEMQPMMADFSTDDVKTWTFKVKDGLTWDDGEKVTSEDVKFTLEYLDEKENTANGEKLEAINIVDERTIELVYKEANLRVLNDLTTLRILPKHIFDTVDDYEGFTEIAAATGCGPYKFVRFDSDAGVIEFAANENYVDGIPNIGTILVKLFKNADTMYMALKAEEIDMVYFYAGGVDAGVTDDLKAAGNLTLSVIKDTSNPVVVVFNNEKAPVNNLAVRQAVAYAIDYDKARELFGSEYSVASNYGFVPDGTNGYIETEPLVRDLDKAAAKLSGAGIVDSDGDGIVELDGEPLEIELLIRSDKPIYARVGELLQANLEEAGILVSFKTVDVPTFRSMSEKEHTNIAMVSRFTAYGMNMVGGMGSAYFDGRQESNAQAQVKDEEFETIVDKLKSAVTSKEYLSAAKDCQEYYAANIPAIALFWDSYVQAYNSKYEGFITDGTFGIMNQATWFNIFIK